MKLSLCCLQYLKALTRNRKKRRQIRFRIKKPEMQVIAAGAERRDKIKTAALTDIRGWHPEIRMTGSFLYGIIPV